MKIYLGNTGSLRHIELVRNSPNLGICYLANAWRYPKDGVDWFLDNGAYYVGKVGTYERLLLARNVGVDSVDSSTFVQCDNSGKFGTDRGIKAIEAFYSQSVLDMFYEAYF